MRIRRFAAFFFFVLLASNAIAQSVEIQINRTATLHDDYVCWSPRPVRARVSGTTDDDVTVVLTSEALSSSSTGQVKFQVESGNAMSIDNFAPKNEINLTLPTSGDWVDFYIAGSLPSTLTKDIVIQARSATDGSPLGSVHTMVRVRKDARTLTQTERQLFLATSRKLLDSGDFEKYPIAHSWGFNYDIHFMHEEPYPPLFLVWHRAFLLNFERELQEIEPDVSLPYWKFDEPSFLQGEPSIFSADFLGEKLDGNPVVKFNGLLSETPNPWHDWRVNGKTRPIERARAVDRTPSFGTGPLRGPIEPDELSDILENPKLDVYIKAGGEIELNYHNQVHRHIGGWLMSRDSPADPLFFLLHANVDRGFAHWQERHDAWDTTGSEAGSYHAIGSYPGSGADYLEGSYALDKMWPWINTGRSGIIFVMPDGLTGPASVPTPASQIDYLNLSGVGIASGACYDDIGFQR